MKKILISLILLLWFLFWWNTYGYNSTEWAKIVEDIKKELQWTKYTFKDNEWSSSKASYHIFYNWKMVWYIYATDNGISMWSWWQEDWEVGTFFTKKDLSKEDILKYFYKYNKNWVITWITKNNFKVINKKISYNKDKKNFRMYFEVNVLKKWNFQLEYSYRIKYPNWWGWETSKKFFLKEISNKIYFWDILHWDNWNNIIDWYKINIYECTSGIDWNNCLWKNKVYSEDVEDLSIYTWKNFNIDEDKIKKANKNSESIKKQITKEKNFLTLLYKQKEEYKQKLIKQWLLKVVVKIDNIFLKLTKKQIKTLADKLHKINFNDPKYKKYRNILIYINTKLYIEVYEKNY